MSDTIKSHYELLFKRYGPSALAVQSRDHKSQIVRFKLLTDISSNLRSVLDVGAGLAHLYSYLRAQGFDGYYLGLELVSDFVKESQSIMANDSCAEIKCFDVSTGVIPNGYDYGFVSGMFNNARDDASEFMYDTLEKLWNVCEQGMAFNLLSNNVDFFDEQLFYADPMEMFKFLKHDLRGHVLMRHDYVTFPDGYPCEVTFHVLKEPRKIISV